MTDKDDIIENNESGRKPRRVRKNPDKDKYVYQIFKSALDKKFLNIDDLFDQDFIDFTMKRILASDKGISLERMKTGLHAAANFYDPIVPLDKVFSEMFEGNYFIMVNNEKTDDYYVFKPTYNQLAKLSLPKRTDLLLHMTNRKFMRTMEDYNSFSERYNLCIVNLDDDDKTQNRGIFIPMLRDCNGVHEDLRSNFVNMYSVEYKDFIIYHADYCQSFEDAESLKTGIRSKFLGWHK